MEENSKKRSLEEIFMEMYDAGYPKLEIALYMQNVLAYRAMDGSPQETNYNIVNHGEHIQSLANIGWFSEDGLEPQQGEIYYVDEEGNRVNPDDLEDYGYENEEGQLPPSAPDKSDFRQMSKRLYELELAVRELRDKKNDELINDYLEKRTAEYNSNSSEKKKGE